MSYFSVLFCFILLCCVVSRSIPSHSLFISFHAIPCHPITSHHITSHPTATHPNDCRERRVLLVVMESGEIDLNHRLRDYRKRAAERAKKMGWPWGEGNVAAPGEVPR